MKRLLLVAWALMLVIPGRRAGGATGSTTICRWKDNKTAAYTRSHDDGPVSQIPWILEVLNAREISMTFFRCVSLTDADDGYRGGWDEWQAIVASEEWQAGGHEYASHTVHHPSTPADTPTDSAIRAELRDSKARIEEMLPDNGKCLTLAYSSSWYNDTIATRCAEYYIAGRGTGGMMIYSDAQGPYFHNAFSTFLVSPSLDPGSNPGMYNIYIASNYNNDAIDAIIRMGGWLNVYTHGIEPADTAQFVPYCDYIYSKRDFLWCGTERDVARYIYERDASAAQVVSADSGRIVLDLTHGLDTTLCNFTFPLTLKTKVPAAWDNVLAVQGAESSVVTAVEAGGTTCVCYSARPNREQIILTKAGATAVRTVKPMDKTNRVRPACPNPVTTAALARYLKENTTVQVCNLAGNPVNPAVRLRPGVYLATGMGPAVKILVTQ